MKFPVGIHVGERLSLDETLAQAQYADQHGYLVDIVDVEKHLDDVVGYYKEQMLNEKPEFAGLNPSIEHFSRILAQTLNERITAKNISKLKVVLWEHENAWAAYSVERQTSKV